MDNTSSLGSSIDSSQVESDVPTSSEMPDKETILDRLSRVQGMKSHVAGMIARLGSIDSDTGKEMLDKLQAAHTGFLEQEEQYRSLLDRIEVLDTFKTGTPTGTQPPSTNPVPTTPNGLIPGGAAAAAAASSPMSVSMTSNIPNGVVSPGIGDGKTSLADINSLFNSAISGSSAPPFHSHGPDATLTQSVLSDITTGSALDGGDQAPSILDAATHEVEDLRKQRDMLKDALAEQQRKKSELPPLDENADKQLDTLRKQRDLLKDLLQKQKQLKAVYSPQVSATSTPPPEMQGLSQPEQLDAKDRELAAMKAKLEELKQLRAMALSTQELGQDMSMDGGDDARPSFAETGLEPSASSKSLPQSFPDASPPDGADARRALIAAKLAEIQSNRNQMQEIMNQLSQLEEKSLAVEGNSQAPDDVPTKEISRAAGLPNGQSQQNPSQPHTSAVRTGCLPSMHCFSPAFSLLGMGTVGTSSYPSASMSPAYSRSGSARGHHGVMDAGIGAGVDRFIDHGRGGAFLTNESGGSVDDTSPFDGSAEGGKDGIPDNYEGKLRELATARSQLNRLQTLMATVENARNDQGRVPSAITDELAHLVDELDSSASETDAADRQPGSVSPPHGPPPPLPNSSFHSGKPPLPPPDAVHEPVGLNDETPDSVREEYERKVVEQKQVLDQLTAERERLTAIHAHLNRLQQGQDGDDDGSFNIADIRQLLGDGPAVSVSSVDAADGAHPGSESTPSLDSRTPVQGFASLPPDVRRSLSREFHHPPTSGNSRGHNQQQLQQPQRIESRGSSDGSRSRGSLDGSRNSYRQQQQHHEVLNNSREMINSERPYAQRQQSGVDSNSGRVWGPHSITEADTDVEEDMEDPYMPEQNRQNHHRHHHDSGDNLSRNPQLQSFRRNNHIDRNQADGSISSGGERRSDRRRSSAAGSGSGGSNRRSRNEQQQQCHHKERDLYDDRNGGIHRDDGASSVPGYRRSSPLAAARPPSPVSSAPPNRGTRRSMTAFSTAPNLDVQYAQLQQHIDSIRDIFAQVIAEQHDPGSTPPRGYPPSRKASVPLNAMFTGSPSWDVTPASSDSHFVPLNQNQQQQQQQQQQLTQQQLLMSLLSCQQQLQLQQLEMRQLQQLCRDALTSNTHPNAASSRRSSVDHLHAPGLSHAPPGTGLLAPAFGHPHQQQQQYRLAAAVGQVGHPSVHHGVSQGIVSHPGQPAVALDGRPLSSGSLYNLLAPNPYLTSPYYPPDQQQQQHQASSTSAAAAVALLNALNLGGASSNESAPGALPVADGSLNQMSTSVGLPLSLQPISSYQQPMAPHSFVSGTVVPAGGPANSVFFKCKNNAHVHNQACLAGLSDVAAALDMNANLNNVSYGSLRTPSHGPLQQQTSVGAYGRSDSITGVTSLNKPPYPATSVGLSHGSDYRQVAKSPSQSELVNVYYSNNTFPPYSRSDSVPTGQGSVDFSTAIGAPDNYPAHYLPHAGHVNKMRQSRGSEDSDHGPERSVDSSRSRSREAFGHPNMMPRGGGGSRVSSSPASNIRGAIPRRSERHLGGARLLDHTSSTDRAAAIREQRLYSDSSLPSRFGTPPPDLATQDGYSSSSERNNRMSRGRVIGRPPLPNNSRLIGTVSGSVNEQPMALSKAQLEELYKSNVAKKQKNFKQEVHQAATSETSTGHIGLSNSYSDPAVAVYNQPELIGNNVSQSGGASYSPLLNLDISGDQLESVREIIYSEVATLISQNENRPEFLLELFKELQLLSSDYLRTRALQAIRQLLNRFLTMDSEVDEDSFVRASSNNIVTSNLIPNSTQRVPPSAPQPELPTESGDSGESVGATVDNGDHIGQAGSQQPRSKTFDNLEDIPNVKEPELNNRLKNGHNTSSRTTSGSDRRIDRIQNKAESSHDNSERHTTATVRDVPAKDSTKTDKKVGVVDLEYVIQEIVQDLASFIARNGSACCTKELLNDLREEVIELSIQKYRQNGNSGGNSGVSDESLMEFFHGQLSSILEDTLSKFIGQQLNATSDELLADVSDVVFNELAFFRVMQRIDGISGAGKPRQAPPVSAQSLSSVSGKSNVEQDSGSRKIERAGYSSDATSEKVSKSRSPSAGRIVLEKPVKVEVIAPTDDEVYSSGMESSSGSSKSRDATASPGITIIRSSDSSRTPTMDSSTISQSSSTVSIGSDVNSDKTSSSEVNSQKLSSKDRLPAGGTGTTVVAVNNRVTDSATRGGSTDAADRMTSSSRVADPIITDPEEERFEMAAETMNPSLSSSVGTDVDGDDSATEEKADRSIPIVLEASPDVVVMNGSLVRTEEASVLH